MFWFCLKQGFKENKIESMANKEKTKTRWVGGVGRGDKWVEKDQGVSQGQDWSAEALWRRQWSLLPLPDTSVLLDVAQRSEALQERRVGIVPHGEQPVSYRKAKVVLVELDEGRVEFRGFAHATCKSICLKLKPATQDCQTERQELQGQNTKT